MRWLKLDGKNAEAANRAAQVGSSHKLDLYADAKMTRMIQPAIPTDRFVGEASGKSLVVGTIRMGFGHYRIAIAMASAAHALGFVPYWYDLCAFEGTTCSRIIKASNKLYSLGSRLSQKLAPFNALYWEPLNSEGFRQLSYNAGDLKNAQLMTAVFGDLPKEVPFIGTHAWTAQAAVASGLTQVVNAIPDNWPMALHLAEGSLHTVQTPSSYVGYRMLRGMAKHPLKPLPKEALVNVGHYVDHELVAGIPADCAARVRRAEADAPLRYLICVGGAGVQVDLIEGIINHLIPLVEAEKAALFINVGDHEDILKTLRRKIPALKGALHHADNFAETETFCQTAEADEVTGVHTFFHRDIFGAVYSTNLLMRICDVLVTKPSELAFYPVPKLMIQRVGGHEAWGAIRAAELGEGSYETTSLEETCALIDLLQEDRSIVAGWCEGIQHAHDQGIYDGAYRCVELASRM